MRSCFYHKFDFNPVLSLLGTVDETGQKMRACGKARPIYARAILARDYGHLAGALGETEHYYNFLFVPIMSANRIFSDIYLSTKKIVK